MPVYTANMLSGNGNCVFPDMIEIDNKNVTYFKGTVIGYKKTVIARSEIASVRIGSGLLFANIYIESAGGHTINAIGFRKKDAREIIGLLSDD